MDKLENEIRGVFRNGNVVKVLHNGLLRRGSKEDVNNILNMLELEGVIKRELRYKCSNEDCHITFNTSKYSLGEEIECEYGHDTILDENTETILYWVKG